MKTYKFYFNDGNQRIYQAYSIIAILEQLESEGDYTEQSIYKIEEI